jgi:hypothetical protein
VVRVRLPVNKPPDPTNSELSMSISTVSSVCKAIFPHIATLLTIIFEQRATKQTSPTQTLPQNPSGTLSVFFRNYPSTIKRFIAVNRPLLRLRLRLRLPRLRLRRSTTHTHITRALRCILQTLSNQGSKWWRTTQVMVSQ